MTDAVDPAPTENGPRPRRRPAGVGASRLLGAGLLVASAVSPAAAAATAWVGDGHAAVRLVTAVESRDAASLDAGVEFRFAAGWHGYWRTPGDAGVPPSIDWTGTSDLGGADVAWPAPSRLVVANLQNAVYRGTVLLPVRLAFPRPPLPGAPTPLRASVDYAACSDVCVPAHADLALGLPAGVARPSPEAPLIAQARASAPGDAQAVGLDVRRDEVAGSGSDRRLVVELDSPARALIHPDLFVEGYGQGLPPAPSVALGDGGLTATLTVPLPAGPDGGPAAQGPLRLTVVDGGRSASLTGPEVPPAPARPGTAPPSDAASTSAGLLAALLSALLGGLILNLMPCVLPVLSLKLAGLAAQAGADRRHVRVGFAATALGIVASFLLLATVLAGMKAAGRAVGWGIQFQQPAFLAFMVVLTATFAASLFDWLHVGLPARVADLGVRGSRSAFARSFLTGAVATLLATPCSAPFVGTAAGFALSGGAEDILAVFLCLGIGMSLPYLAAALFPGVAGWVPRPGRWMVALRRVLGSLLLATAGWLALLLSGLIGPTAAGSVAVAVAALVAFLGWSAEAVPFGSRGRPRAVAFALAVLAIAVAITSPRPAGRSAPDGREASMFDPDAIAPIVASGGTVLVDVSAAWCLTCKVNELTALDSAEVRGRLARPGTVVMRADWTRPDAAVAEYLNSFDRYGIPLDVVYGPGRPAGEPLPELLTPGVVLSALDRAAGRP